MLALAALVAMALALAAWTVGAQRRPAPPFGLAGNGVVAFDRDGTIIVANPDGSSVTELVTAVGDARGPVFSPDGTRFAFYGSVDGSVALLVTGFEDGKPVVVSRGLRLDDLSMEAPPAWSPTSDRIAFTGLEDGEHRLYVARVDGSDTRAIGGAGMSRVDPAWSPDGAWIAYQGSRVEDQAGLGPYEIAAGLYIIRPDGSGETALATGSGGSYIFRRPQWRPDPERPMLAYSVGQPSAYDIVVYDIGTHRQQEVSTEPAAELWPAWSPDGSLLAWGASDRLVRVARPDGTVIHRTVQPIDYDFVWSPDGDYLLGWTSESREALTIVGVGQSAGAARINVDGVSQSHWSWQRRAP